MQNNKMGSYLDNFTKIKLVVDKIISLFLIMIVACMTILVTYQVVARYLFDSPSAISEVLSRYLFIWLILFGSAYVFGLKEHMAITFIKDKFSQKNKIFVEMFIELVTVVFAFSIMIFGGYKSASRQMWQLDSALQIPMGAIYSAIPVSGCIILFYFIYNEFQLTTQLVNIKNCKTKR